MGRRGNCCGVSQGLCVARVAAGGGGGGTPTPMTVSLTKITPSPVELGAELPVGLQFTAMEANAAGALVTRTIQDDQGNPAVDILGQGNPTPAAGMGVVQTKTLIGEQVAYTYQANDGTTMAQDVETYTWLPRVYAGVATAAVINEGFIEALAESELRADRGIDRAGLAWALGDHIWVAFPQAFNPTTGLEFSLQIGGAGFPGGFVLDTAGVSVTPNTPNGVPLLYDVWRSTGTGIGLSVDLTVDP